MRAIESAEAAVDSLQDSCFNLEERIEELNETKQNIQEDSQKQGNNLLTSLTSGSTFYCFPQGKAVKMRQKGLLWPAIMYAVRTSGDKSVSSLPPS